MSQAQGNQRLRGFSLDESDFAASDHSSGDESAVYSTTVPNGRVWFVPAREPLEVYLVHRQTVTVPDASTATLDLTPEAPRVPTLTSPVDGEYRDTGVLAAYNEGNNPATLVTGSSTVQYTGTFTTTDDFIQDVQFEDTGNSGGVTVAVYSVQKFGQATLRKKSPSGVPEDLQKNTQIEHAFANPDAPDSDQAVRWGNISGLSRVIPPGFDFEIVFFADSNTVDVDDTNASNAQVSIPLQKRRLKPDESASELKRKVRNHAADQG